MTISSLKDECSVKLFVLHEFCRTKGKLRTRKWTDQSGTEKYTTEIVLHPMNGVMQMIGGKSSDNGNQQSQQRKQLSTTQKPPANETPMDDDIPF